MKKEEVMNEAKEMCPGGMCSHLAQVGVQNTVCRMHSTRHLWLLTIRRGMHEVCRMRCGLG